MSKCVHLKWKDWPSNMTPYLDFPFSSSFPTVPVKTARALAFAPHQYQTFGIWLTISLTSSQNSQDLFQQAIMVKGSAVEEAANFPSLSSEISLETIFCPVNLWHYCADPGVGHCHHWWLQLQWLLLNLIWVAGSTPLVLVFLVSAEINFLPRLICCSFRIFLIWHVFANTWSKCACCISVGLVDLNDS